MNGSKTESLASARERIEALEAKTAELCLRQAETGTALIELRATAGERFLDGVESDIPKIIELEARLDLISRALDTLSARRAAAELDLRRATAEDFRLQALRKREELATLEKSTAKLLRQLSELEGVKYSGCILNSQRSGAWFELLRGSDAPAAEYLRPSEVFPEPVGASAGVYALSNNRRLVDEIRELETRAEQIEAELLEASEPPHPAPWSAWSGEPPPPAPAIVSINGAAPPPMKSILTGEVTEKPPGEWVKLPGTFD